MDDDGDQYWGLEVGADLSYCRFRHIVFLVCLDLVRPVEEGWGSATNFLFDGVQIHSFISSSLVCLDVHTVSVDIMDKYYILAYWRVESSWSRLTILGHLTRRLLRLENARHLEADELTVGPLFGSLSTAMELF